MKDIETKREREKRMVSQMIALYCRRNHHTSGALCPECAALNDYAGPRMIFYHPVAAVRHVVETKREKKRLERENR